MTREEFIGLIRAAQRTYGQYGEGGYEDALGLLEGVAEHDAELARLLRMALEAGRAVMCHLRTRTEFFSGRP